MNHVKTHLGIEPESVFDVKATSHTRLRAHDHYTSSTLIGGKGGGGPSSLHTTLEGPTVNVNARWMYNTVYMDF